MSAKMSIILARPSFWSEPRDPEAWLRALVTLEAVLSKSETSAIASPRSAWERHLSGALSRRSVPGLFGLDCSKKPAKLLGVGLLVQPTNTKAWSLSEEARSLLSIWRDITPQQALEALAVYLLRWSVWLRLLLLRLALGDWQLINWHRLRGSNAHLTADSHLILKQQSAPTKWTQGIERACLGAWTAKWIKNHSPLTSPFVGGNEGDAERTVTLKPYIPKTAKKSDSFSWAPLKGPLYLLDSLGWMRANGMLLLPAHLAQKPELALLSPLGNSPATQLTEATTAHADVRGFSPVEPVMRSLAQRAGIAASVESPGNFEQWMDALLGAAFQKGAIELHAAEPGQARHGRGLFGDRQRKLVRWTIHPEFDALFQSFKI